MATDSGSESTSSLDSLDSSEDSSLVLSYESFSFGSGDESGPEGVHPFLYEPLVASGSDDGDTSGNISKAPKYELVKL